MKFQEMKYIGHLNYRVRTPFGFQKVEYVYKTVPLECLRITHEYGEIEVATGHTFIVDEEEIYAEDLKAGDFLEISKNSNSRIFKDYLGSSGSNKIEDSLNSSKSEILKIDNFLKSNKSKILKIENLGIKVLYDISLDCTDFENQWYYSSGVLSHNSGKSITVACYLVWLFNFHRQKNIGIVANRKSQAKEFLKNTKEIFTRLPMWMSTGITEWNKESISNELEMRIMIDVPSGDSFRGFSINCLVVDECAFINSNNWEEFADSIFPSQGALAWKKNVIISTAKGLNHFYEIVQRAKASTIKSQATGESDGTVLVEVDWREVPRYNADGTRRDPDEFKEAIIKKYGRAYFEQNYGNNFTGSAETLWDTDILEAQKAEEVLEYWGTPASELVGPNSAEISNALKLYDLPRPNRVYTIGVDAAKDGEDFFAIQIIDITEFPFRQVASAQLQVNYLEMPEYLYNWGAEFNSALMIIENNEGAGQSCADSLVQFYDYPNLYFDKGKKFPGFRTNKKSRDSILKLMQILGNSKKIEIVDRATIGEMEKFEKVNSKYEARDGHDDLVMSLALSIAPLLNMDNYEDYGKFLESLRSEDPIDTSSFLADLSGMTFADF